MQLHELKPNHPKKKRKRVGRGGSREPMSEEQVWDTLEYFLKEVIPVADKYKIKMALHPDDPPLSPLGTTGRILTSAANYRKLMNIVPSPMNGITFCQANFKLMGEDIYKDIGSIRSLLNPKARFDPDTYLGEYWFNTINSHDNGGVHTNSGVQNHWFYLLSEGGSGENDDGISFQVTGIGLDDASAIAYRNLVHYLLPDSRYVDAATYSIQATEDLFGEDSQQALSVMSAWEAVGIYMDSRLMTSDTLLQFESDLNDSEYKYLSLLNKSIESLNITEFNFSDPDHFSLQPPQVLPFQLNAGDSLRLWVVFSPENDSLYNESLIIESSDPMLPAQTIHLSGLGTGVTTGLSDNYQSQPGIKFSVSPNPFSEQLLISYALPRPDYITIEIRDITGKLLYQLTREASGKETVEIIWSSLPNNPYAASGGIYLLSLRTSTQVLVKKIVKQ